MTVRRLGQSGSGGQAAFEDCGVAVRRSATDRRRAVGKGGFVLMWVSFSART